MCRLVGWVSATPVTVREVLGDPAVERLLHLADIHCHGWGAAIVGDAGVEVRRSPERASVDPAFHDFVDSAATTAGLLHLRMGTPGYGRRDVENHPFTDVAWAFAHNGAVLPPDAVDALLPPSGGQRPLGTTDSERIFLALMHGLRGERLGPRDVADAFAVVIIDRAGRSGLHASSWNSLLLGPDGLFVINNHDRSWVAPDIKLWPDIYPPQVAWPPYFDLRVRERDGNHVVLSSGIVDDVDGWDLLPNGVVVHLGANSTEPLHDAGALSR
jgi:hypothetical protein